MILTDSTDFLRYPLLVCASPTSRLQGVKAFTVRERLVGFRVKFALWMELADTRCDDGDCIWLRAREAKDELSKTMLPSLYTSRRLRQQSACQISSVSGTSPSVPSRWSSYSSVSRRIRIFSSESRVKNTPLSWFRHMDQTRTRKIRSSK